MLIQRESALAKRDLEEPSWPCWPWRPPPTSRPAAGAKEARMARLEAHRAERGCWRDGAARPQAVAAAARDDRGGVGGRSLRRGRAGGRLNGKRLQARLSMGLPAAFGPDSRRAQIDGQFTYYPSLTKDCSCNPQIRDQQWATAAFLRRRPRGCYRLARGPLGPGSSACKGRLSAGMTQRGGNRQIA